MVSEHLLLLFRGELEATKARIIVILYKWIGVPKAFQLMLYTTPGELKRVCKYEPIKNHANIGGSHGWRVSTGEDTHALLIGARHSLDGVSVEGGNAVDDQSRKWTQ